jgi:hypothetical protein
MNPQAALNDWFDRRGNYIVYMQSNLRCKLRTCNPMVLWDNPCVCFTHEFLCVPSEGWEIDWSGAACDWVRREGGFLFRHDDGHERQCLKGVIVRNIEHQQVWVLTGEWDVMGNGYEGHWPD